MTSFAPNTTTRKGLEFSFAGCGFLGIYHLGVSACLKKYSGALLIENVAGASAGCFAGAALLASGDFSEFIVTCYCVVAKCFVNFFCSEW